MYKNISKETILNLSDQVSYQEGQVVSKTLVQNESISITLFAFDKGEEISTHQAPGDAMVILLDGKGKFTIDGKEYHLKKDDSIIMPKNIPHSVFAEEKFKMFLSVSF